MRSQHVLAIAILFLATLSLAQAPTPTAKLPGTAYGSNELFVGYMYQPTDWGTFNLNGFDANYTRFFSDRFGAVVDIDYGLNNDPPPKLHSFTYGVGPRFNLTKGTRIQPYIEFIAGGANLTAYVPEPTRTSPLARKSWHGFQYEAGGGIDFRLTHHLGARFEGDWNGVPYGNHDHSDWQRVAFGAIWKW